VPEQNLLAKEGDGFKIALTAIDESRITVAAEAIGISQAALDASVSYAMEQDLAKHGWPHVEISAVGMA
jgi:alkylation response protein AidB-like acyl-CoA dehydrogenase